MISGSCWLAWFALPRRQSGDSAAACDPHQWRGVMPSVQPAVGFPPRNHTPLEQSRQQGQALVPSPFLQDVFINQNCPDKSPWNGKWSLCYLLLELVYVGFTLYHIHIMFYAYLSVTTSLFIVFWPAKPPKHNSSSFDTLTGWHLLWSQLVQNCSKY